MQIILSMLRLLFVNILTFFFAESGYSQLLYPIVGMYKNKSAQGMAIHGNYAYLMNDGGGCRVLNLSSGQIDCVFNLGCSQYNPHANTACFGIERTLNGEIPLIYISEFRKPYRCFVEQINNGSSQIVQIISAKDKGKDIVAQNWVIDRDNGFLYMITRGSKVLDSDGLVHNKIRKYRLPKLEEGMSVELNDSDLLDNYYIDFENMLQGVKIRNNMMYVVSGFHEMLSHRKDSKRALIIIDLGKRKVVKKISLSKVTTNEPEDMDFYGNKGLLYCGQNGGLYEIEIQ